MPRIQVVVNVGTVYIGADYPALHVDCDLKPTQSLHEWIQRRGRVQRAYPAIQGDRSYQTRIEEECREALRRKKNPLVVAGCGAGKSYIACKIAQAARAKGKSIGFITVRRVLVADISDRLNAFGVPHGVLMPPYKDNDHPTKVASIHTLAARDITLDVDCLFLDEAPLYLSTQFLEVIKRHNHIPRICLTASPCRADGQGLGRLADEIIMGPSIEELIGAKFLVPTRIFTRSIPDTSKLDVNSSGEYNEPQLATLMSRPAIVGDLVKEWLYRANNLPTIVHAVNCAHADVIVARFAKAGVNAVSISADTPDDERKSVFDNMCRDAPPKKHALLLDLAGNVAERFGRPEDAREWTLDDVDPKKPHVAVLSVRRCDKCWFTYRSSTPQCPECGNAHVPTVRQIREKSEALVEYQREKKAAAMDRYREGADVEKKIAKLAALIRTANDNGYKIGYVFAKFNAIFKEKPTKEITDAAFAAAKR